MGLKGEEVTLDLLRAGEVQQDQRAVFFTNGLLFGEHLEVKEVGLLPVPADTAKLRAEIAALRAQTGDETLKARLTSAVLVVNGKVLETRPLKRTTRGSEHEADWAEAIIAVEKVEKGAFRGTKVTVYFPRSTDERWLLSPKFRSGVFEKRIPYSLFARRDSSPGAEMSFDVTSKTATFETLSLP